MVYIIIVIFALGFLSLLFRKPKAKKMIPTKEQILYDLLKDIPSASFDPKSDAVVYLGSMPYDEILFNDLIQSSTDIYTEIAEQLKKYTYLPTQDNLLIYGINKTSQKERLIVVVTDPVSMDADFSLYKVIGPFRYPL